MHPELPVIAGQGRQRLDVQPDAQQPGLLPSRLAQKDLPAHSEVRHDRTTWRALQRDPEELASSGGGLHDTPGQQCLEGTGEGIVPPQRSLFEHLDPEDGRARDRRCETGADDLNLGKLGHGGGSARSRR